MKKYCYKCGKEATNREHIPPICLFPKNTDIKRYNFRKDLITVPSCDKHNTLKSDDDEFLMFSLSSLIVNNPIGEFHHYTKVSRALKRKNDQFIEKEVLRNRKVKKVQLKDGNHTLIAIGNPNYKRLTRCFRLIAYGLFYHEFKQSFQGQIKVLIGFIDYTDKNEQTFKQFIKRRFELEDKLMQPLKGNNPEVFTYQFHSPDEYGIHGLRTTFYGASEVYYAFIPSKSIIPENIVFSFYKAGIPTIISLGNENFEFNKTNNTD